MDQEMCQCEHPDTWFSRSLCPDPCGFMHTYCIECGDPLDGLCGESARDQKED